MVLGNALSCAVTGYFFQDAETADDIKTCLNRVLITQTLIIGPVFLFFQFFFRDRPETPPSTVALAPVEKLSMKIGIKALFGNRSLILLTVSFMAFFGLACCLGTILSGLFNPFGQTPHNLAMFGLIVLFGGFFGACVTGYILDKTSAYKRLI